MDIGATLVAIGTESFRDPTAGARIARELDDKNPCKRASIPSTNLDVSIPQPEV